MLGPGGFLFVNKNAQSTSFSRAGSREEAAAINSYAQKGHLELNNSNSRGRKKQNSSSADQPTQVRPLAAYVSKLHIHELIGESKPKRRRPKPPKKPGDVVDDEAKHPPGSQSPRPKFNFTLSLPTPSDSELSESPSPRLMTINRTPGASVDPFQTSSLPINGDVLPVLQYYLHFTLFSTFSARTTTALTPAQLAHSSAIQSIFTGCLGNTAHMYALLSATASRMRRVSNVSFAPTQSPEFFLGRAIQSVRDSLAIPTALSDQLTILDIFHLSVCEWYMGSYDGARTHFSFLRHFWKDVDPRQGVLQKYIHDLISYNDIFLGVETGHPPFFELKLEPGPLSDEQMVSVRDVSGTTASLVDTSSSSSLDPATSIYGSSFNYLLRHDRIGADLRPILESIPQLMQLYHFILQSTAPCPKKSAILSQKSQSLIHRLTSAPAYGYELCIRLSLIVLLSCMSTSAARRAGKSDMLRLAQRLSMQLEYEIMIDLLNVHGRVNTSRIWTGVDGDMLLWILLTGMFAAGRSQEAEWFAARASNLAKLLKFSKAQLEDLLHSFVYLPGLQQEMVDRCMEPPVQKKHG